MLDSEIRLKIYNGTATWHDLDRAWLVEVSRFSYGNGGYGNGNGYGHGKGEGKDYGNGYGHGFGNGYFSAHLRD